MAKGQKKRQQICAKRRGPQQQQQMALARWAFLCSTHHVLDHLPPSAADWIPAASSSDTKPFLIDLHTHSTRSDGMLSPLELVQRAVSSGVQVLALTDHDTMAGVPEALQEAKKHKIRLIPGVEISAQLASRGSPDSVHILGYYSSCGPMRWQELEGALSHIREGRYHRARAIVSSLNSLKKPVEWGQVIAIAGAGIAPGRVHIARALVEAGHVCNLREAFSKYLYDGGPASASGHEMAAEDAVRLIQDTGGISALAHPWSLKDPLSVVKRLKSVGLHAIEVYRGSGKASGFNDLAALYKLLKLGGSDFHGRGDPDEVKLGKVPLPMPAISEFLEVAQPVWIDSIKGLLQNFADETFEIKSDKVVGLKYFTSGTILNGDVMLRCSIEGEKKKALLRLSPWLTQMERIAVEEVAVLLKLDVWQENEDGNMVCVVSQQV